jgi:IS605 OrfB family transposase
MVRSLFVLDTARSTFSGAPPTLRRRTSRLTAAWRPTGSRQFGKLLSQRPRCDTPKEIDEVTAEGELTVSTIVDVVVVSHQPWILVGMQLRYRYRLTPTVEQRQALARAFGCARVVYNDALRLREEAHTAGRPFRSDSEVLRLVTTLAKRTPERAWLTEVSAVVLQQSVADLHRAYRNYFRVLAEAKSERTKGDPRAKLRVRKPHFKSKRGEQAVRFTANSRFRILANGRLSLPKIGDVAVRWSRPLPAPPSSVTVTLDRSGRYHASFVVEVARNPLPVVEREVGIDLGLHVLAALSDGTTVPNPRWLRRAERALRRAQRTLSRRRQGSTNWHKARRKVARLHARVADARRDFHHQLSTRLIRENQAVYLENLDVAALGRSKLAKSLADAGWGQFAAMLAYKANLYGRTVVRIDRWCPSSQQCSACGAKTGPKGRTGLKLRTWTCPACAVVHDRDVNAARNILAAGRAVTACGGDVRPGPALAVAATPLGTEAGTPPGTAA